MVVCLIAGLQTTGIDSVPFTALNQCRWQTDVVVNDPNNIIKEGDHLLKKVNWLYHEQMAYIMLHPETIRLQLQPVTGTWISINKSQPATPVTEKVFLPALVHEKQQASTGYVIAYCNTSKEAQQLAARPTWKIISNTTTCQAVQFDNGDIMAAFRLAGSIDVAKGHVWWVNKPCMVMLSGNTIYASDPSHTGFRLDFSMDGSHYSLNLPADGNTVRISR
jgi:chondroitin AC lyase